jgi:hypothetical protein
VEQRQAPRLVYRDLKISYNGLTQTVSNRSPDLTPQGMFINTPRLFPPGALLKLRFDLVRTGVIVQALGDVRYWLPDTGVGVHFVNLPEYARAAIEKELEIMKNENEEVETKK